MVRRDDQLVVLWPRYFDARLSRGEGRRVPARLAVKKPDAAWVESAAKKAGLKATLEEDARHPSLAHRKMGRVLVPKQGSKEDLLRKVGEVMAGSQD